MHIYIITGLSGSGKSTAIAAFEDSGYYCVDNMPAALLPNFLALPVESAYENSGLAFVMDLREKDFLNSYAGVFALLRQQGYAFSVIFMEADENELIQRFSSTRRRHPLFQGKGLIQVIRAEKKQLADLRAEANIIIDTSHKNVHELKAKIFDIARSTGKPAVMHITVMSFGFSNGIPRDADIVMDVRFLKNPYFVPELKHLTGLDNSVLDFVLNKEDTRQFLDKYLDLLDYLIPLYEKEGKIYLTAAVGCTGGKHRSVAIATKVTEHIAALDKQVSLIHRDIDI